MKNVRAGLVCVALASAFGQDASSGESSKPSPFAAVVDAREDELKFVQKLRDFDVTDLKGRRWTGEQLKGRITVIYVWAALCLPCRQENPKIQQLFEATAENRNRDGVQLLTIGMDSVREFMKEKNYTFPVIMRFALEDDFLPYEGPPQVWIIDRSGRRSETFRTWSVGKVLIEAERLARSRSSQ